MNPEEIKDRIVKALDEVERQVKQDFGNQYWDDDALKCEILEWASAHSLREALSNFMTRRDSSAGLQALTLFAWWRDELPVLTPKITAASVGNAIKTTWSGLINYLQPILTLIHQQLWTLLSSLLTVKEWSLTGGAGAGVLGLTGNVEIEITFT